MSSVQPPLPPTEGTPPGRARLPWEERGRLGVLEGFVQTLQLLVTQPSDGFARLRADGDLVSPLLFGLLVSWLAMAVSQIWNLALSSTLRGLFGGFRQLDGLLLEAPSLVGAVAFLVVWPIIFILAAFMGSAVLHGCLLLVSGVERSELGFEGTLKVYLYSMVSWVAVLIPVAGNIVASLWSLVLLVIGFAVVHRTTQGRALVAVLIPALLCCACLLVLFVAFGALLAGGGWGGLP